MAGRTSEKEYKKNVPEPFSMHLLEANPNAQLAYGEDLAESAERAGISYEALIQRILNIGLSWKPESQR